MEANRLSLISRGACALLVALPFVPVIEYLGGMEPVRRSLAYLVLLDLKQGDAHVSMAMWALPAILGAVRLSGVAYKAHVVLAALSGAFGVFEFLLAAVDTSSLTLARLQVYTGLTGVAPPHHYGLHASLVAGLSLVWMFDELWARREFKSANGI